MKFLSYFCNKKLYFSTAPYFIRFLYPKKVVWDIPNAENRIYLTFDDGPHPEITPKVLEILSNYNIKATFFLVGNNITKYPDVFEMLKSQGHSIGNHTFNHTKSTKIPFTEYLKEVELCQNLTNTNLFRPPHGLINRRLAKELSENYRIILWSVLSCDFDIKLTPEQCYNKLIKNTKTGSIVVFHDSVKAAPRMLPILPQFIEFCLGNNFKFGVL